MNNLVKIVGSVVVVGATLVFLIYETMSEELTYFFTADEVLAAPAAHAGQRIRLGGYVEECSILQRTGTLEYLFEVRPDPPRATHHALKHPEMRGKTITVHYTGAPPDTFKDQAEVIVTGKLQPDGTFAGTDLIAKCPSKYESAEAQSGIIHAPPVDCSKKRGALTANP